MSRPPIAACARGGEAGERLVREGDALVDVALEVRADGGQLRQFGRQAQEIQHLMCRGEPFHEVLEPAMAVLADRRRAGAGRDGGVQRLTAGQQPIDRGVAELRDPGEIERREPADAVERLRQFVGSQPDGLGERPLVGRGLTHYLPYTLRHIFAHEFTIRARCENRNTGHRVHGAATTVRR